MARRDLRQSKLKPLRFNGVEALARTSRVDETRRLAADTSAQLHIRRR
jgi:hypothetical protein